MDNPTTIISQNIINVDIDSRAVTLEQLDNIATKIAKKKRLLYQKRN